MPSPLIRALVQREVNKADCSRRRVGAVLALNGVVVGKGHNALPRGSCEMGDCPRGKLSYEEQPADVGYEKSGCFSEHAEEAALREAGERARGAVIYVSEMPCPRCAKALRDAGVIRAIKVSL